MLIYLPIEIELALDCTCILSGSASWHIPHKSLYHSGLHLGASLSHLMPFACTRADHCPDLHCKETFVTKNGSLATQAYLLRNKHAEELLTT